MCYRNGYGCSCCSQEENGKKEGENLKGMTRQEFQEAVKVLGAICDMLENEEDCYDDDPILMIAITPGKALKLITEEEAGEYLPCFGKDDVIDEAPDVELVMSYDRKLLFTVGDQKYLDGPALIYDLDEEGEVMPVTAEDIYRVQQMLKRRTLMVTEEGEKMPVISLN